MAITQVAWIQAETYQAVDQRLADTVMFGGPSTTLARPGGVVPGFGGALACSTGGGLTVTITSGAALVASNAGSGSYRVVNDANLTRTVTAGSATLRIDLIIVKVYDTGVAATSYGDVEVVQGTAGAGVPAMPAGINAVKIAEINVTNSVTTVADKRTWTAAVGGILPCTSTTRPANPYDGFTVWESDTFNYATWSAVGGAWRTVPTGSTGAWTAYTPTWGASTTNPTMGSSSINGRYIKNGKTVTFTVSLQIVTGGAFGVGSGVYSITLPLTAVTATNGRWLVTAHYYAPAAGTTASKQWPGTGLIVSGGTKVDEVRLAVGDPTQTTKGGLWTNTAPFAPANGDNLTLTGTYETV